MELHLGTDVAELPSTLNNAELLDGSDSTTLFADTSFTTSATSSVAGWKKIKVEIIIMHNSPLPQKGQLMILPAQTENQWLILMDRTILYPQPLLVQKLITILDRIHLESLQKLNNNSSGRTTDFLFDGTP